MTTNNNTIPIDQPESFKQQQPPSTPRDARIIAILLASMGVQSSSEGVVRVLMEFAHRYTVDILSDAMVYADHAGRAHAAHGPDVEDVRLAVQAKVEHSMSGPMSKEFLLNLADTLNRTSLPPIPDRYGIRLPPEKDRLTAPNFDIAPKAPSSTTDQPMNADEDMFGGLDDDDDDDSDSSSDTETGLSPIITINGNGTNADHGKRRLEDMEDDDYD
ncbi:transcription initiation factor TFIID subunit 9 [Melampsora americana]|nr:transcription initiation factor TFIID subunit 9 [Melampsora americana]